MISEQQARHMLLHSWIEERQRGGSSEWNFIQDLQSRLCSVVTEEVGARSRYDSLLRLALLEHRRCAAHRNWPGSGTLHARR